MPAKVSGLKELGAYLSKIKKSNSSKVPSRNTRLILCDLGFGFEKETADQLLFDAESKALHQKWIDQKHHLEAAVQTTIPNDAETSDRAFQAAVFLSGPQDNRDFQSFIPKIRRCKVEDLRAAMREETPYMLRLIGLIEDLQAAPGRELDLLAEQQDMNLWRAYAASMLDPVDIYNASVILDHQIQSTSHKRLVDLNNMQRHGWFGSAMLSGDVEAKGFATPDLAAVSDCFTDCRFMILCSPDELSYKDDEQRRTKQIDLWVRTFERLLDATQPDPKTGHAELHPGDVVCIPLALERTINNESKDLPITVEPKLATYAKMLVERGITLVVSAGNTAPQLCREDFQTTCGLDLKQWSFNVDGVASGVILASDHNKNDGNTRCVDATIPFNADKLTWAKDATEDTKREMADWLAGASSSCVFVAAAIAAVNNVAKVHLSTDYVCRPQDWRAQIREYQLDLLSDRSFPLDPESLLEAQAQLYEFSRLRFCDYFGLCVGNGWIQIVRAEDDTRQPDYTPGQLIDLDGNAFETSMNAYYDLLKEDAFLCPT